MIRIASLLPSATEIVCRLGLADALVGVTHECDYPDDVRDKPALTASRIQQPDMSSAEIDHAVRTQLDGHGSVYDLDEEQLRELEPDLILTQELCEVCAVNYSTVEQAARRLDGEARIVSLEPNTLDDVLANITTVGELTGAQDAAGRLVDELRGRLDALDRATADVAHRPRTAVLEWLDPVFAPGHWVPEQVAHAGGEASFGNRGGDSHTTTADELTSYDPEVIVLAPCGFVMSDVLRHVPRTTFPEGWNELPAVEHFDVFAVDASSHFSRPGPRLVDGTEILGQILHPEVFGEPVPQLAMRVETR